MARALRSEGVGFWYHVMCRGNGGQHVFVDNKDCEAGGNDACAGTMLRAVFTGRHKEGHGRRGKERGEQGGSPGSQPRPAGQASHGNPGKGFMKSVQCTPDSTRLTRGKIEGGEKNECRAFPASAA